VLEFPLKKSSDETAMDLVTLTSNILPCAPLAPTPLTMNDKSPQSVAQLEAASDISQTPFPQELVGAGVVGDWLGSIVAPAEERMDDTPNPSPFTALTL